MARCGNCLVQRLHGDLDIQRHAFAREQAAQRIAQLVGDEMGIRSARSGAARG
jgi:hypothetical protein